MKLVITGAAKGIGKNLAEVMKKKHEVTAIVRSLNTISKKIDNINYCPYSQKSFVDEYLKSADCVIHCALDRKIHRRDFLSKNLDLNKYVLEQSLKGTCKLFIYFSSQVVYSGIEQADETGYHEDQKCHMSGREDNYTKLKILSEQMIIESCQSSRMKFLILRPTIVIGEGLAWIDSMIKLIKWFPFGIKNRKINLIHVDDLSLMVDKLLDLEVYNQIFNIGGYDWHSDYYFQSIGRLCSRRIIFIPDFIIKYLSEFIPSTFWFFRKNVRVNCNKVKSVTGIQPKRSMEDIFLFNSFGEYSCDSLDRLKSIQQSSVRFRTYGIGYFLRLNPDTGFEKKILLEKFNGIVSLKDDLVTVKSGTMLSDIVKFLEQYNLTLPTLPEFTGSSAGACFFVEVHGSSCDYFSLYDLITEIKYLDNGGNVVVSKKDDVEWEELRKRNVRFTLIELTFKCSKFSYLCNKIEWKADDVLLEYIAYAHKLNMSTTIQWYPYYNKCLIYHINKIDHIPSSFVKARPLYRNSPYPIQKLITPLIMRGKSLQYDKCYKILGPWENLPLRSLILPRISNAKLRVKFDLEFYVPLGDGVNFVSVLKERISRGEIFFKPTLSIGFRFSYKKIADRESMGFIWIELVCRDLDFVNHFISIARNMSKNNINFHKGKYLPSLFTGSL